jgi:hypothetical protein
MASQTLTDQTVSSTYQGVLHANGEALPLTDVAAVYDGSGQASALSLGLSSQGASIAGGFSCSGQLTAGEIRYTTTDSVSGANFPLVSDGNATAVFGQMTSDALIDLSPSPAGAYGSIQYMAVNSKGLVTSVVGGPETATAWVTFEGADKAFSYTINNLLVQCLSFGHTIAAGNVITIKSATDAGLNGSFTVQAANVTDGTFSFANPTGITSSSGTAIVDVTIKSSYNVSSVVCNSVGIYSVYFSTHFKNRDYVSLCNARYPNTTPTDIENLNANTVSTQKEYVRVRSFYITNSDQVVEYDDGRVSVYCIGSTAEDNSPTPVTFDNFIKTNYLWGESYSPGGAQQQIITVTPSLMAANRWNAIILGVSSYMHCRSGGASLTTTNIVDSLVTSNLAWSSYGNSGAQVYIYNVFLYTNNQLKYAQFYTTNSGWTTETVNSTDINNGAASAAIFSGLASQMNLVGQFVNVTESSTGTWLSNFLSTYSNQLTPVNSVGITLISNAGRDGPCYGGFNMFQTYARYFTAQ